MESTTAQEAKRRARAEVRRRINALPRELRARKSRQACEHLLRLREIQAAGVILAYVALPDELDIRPALGALREAGTRIVLPRCLPEQHDLLCIEVHDLEQDLAPGTFGIPEPTTGDPVSPDCIDALAAPGRAFDRQGNRVGRGAGYFDRMMAGDEFRAFVCGIGFDCQVFPRLPAEPHDVPVDALVTESGVVRIRRPARAQNE